MSTYSSIYAEVEVDISAEIILRECGEKTARKIAGEILGAPCDDATIPPDGLGKIINRMRFSDVAHLASYIDGNGKKALLELLERVGA